MKCHVKDAIAKLLYAVGVVIVIVVAIQNNINRETVFFSAVAMVLGGYELLFVFRKKKEEKP